MGNDHVPAVPTATEAEQEATRNLEHMVHTMNTSGNHKYDLILYWRDENPVVLGIHPYEWERLWREQRSTWRQGWLDAFARFFLATGKSEARVEVGGVEVARIYPLPDRQPHLEDLEAHRAPYQPQRLAASLRIRIKWNHLGFAFRR